MGGGRGRAGASPAGCGAVASPAQSAYAEARRRGYQEGLEESQTQTAAQILQAVAGTIAYLAAIEGRLAGIVLGAVRKIIDEFDNETLVFHAVRNGLGLLRRDQRVTLRVAPQTAPGLRQKLSEALPDAEFIEVVPDSCLNPSDCILESELGIVEASIDSQLEAIRRAVESRLGVDQGQLCRPP